MRRLVTVAPVASLDERITTHAILACRGLRKTFGALVAVDDVGFEIGSGETYGLLGPNGAGKTTTISIVAGLLERDAGEVLLDGRSMTTAEVKLRASIGYVPQELAIYPDLTGAENLRFFARLYGLGGVSLKRRVGQVLELVGLSDRGGDRAKEYSGGMKRRLNIAIGLLHRPKLLILDEPTVGVDPQSRNAILESVDRLAAEGMAVLYTTHYMEEAERLCDRVGIIDLGRLRAEGTPRELVGLVGEHDRIHVMVRGDAAAALDACQLVPGVGEAAATDGRLDLVVDDGRALLPRVLESIRTSGAWVSAVEVTEPNLEDVFLHLTGKALRD